MSTQAVPHVLQVVHHLDLGGSEEVALAIAEQLQGPYRLSFYAINGVRDTPVGLAMKARLDRIGVPVYSGTRLSPKRGGFLVGAAKLAAVSWRLRPDIVHLHTEIPELTHALSRLFLNNPPGRVPTLTRTMHNTVYWGPWQWLGGQVERRQSQVRGAACSQAALDGMQRFRAGKGLPPLGAERSRVIYNGVAPATVQCALPRPPGPVRVLFAGRLEPQKGVDLLPGILAHAGPPGPEGAVLDIYGSGSLDAALRPWAEGTVPGWTVRMLPPTPNLRALMAGYDVMLMPSRFEGLGLVAAEALMSGLPVIGTRVAGLDEVFPEHYPLLAAAEDTAALGTLLAQVLQDPEQMLERAQGWAAPTAEKFGVGRMGRQYSELYRQLLQDAVRAGQARPSGVP